jgi:hypothetical protein
MEGPTPTDVAVRSGVTSSRLLTARRRSGGIKFACWVRAVLNGEASGLVPEVLHTINPRIQSDSLVGFFVDTSLQTLNFHRDDDGLEWLSVEKSPTGSPGASRLVSYESEPPYVDFV